MAAAHNDAEFVELLLNYGADIDAIGPIHETNDGRRTQIIFDGTGEQTPIFHTIGARLWLLLRSLRLSPATRTGSIHAGEMLCRERNQGSHAFGLCIGASEMALRAGRLSGDPVNNVRSTGKLIDSVNLGLPSSGQPTEMELSHNNLLPLPIRA